MTSLLFALAFRIVSPTKRPPKAWGLIRCSFEGSFAIFSSFRIRDTRRLDGCWHFCNDITQIFDASIRVLWNFINLAHCRVCDGHAGWAVDKTPLVLQGFAVLLELFFCTISSGFRPESLPLLSENRYKEQMMLLSTCAQLKSLSTLLREKYDVRNKNIARGFRDTNLLTAEFEIIRVQKVITRHRRRCSYCKVHETSALGADIRLRPLPSEAPYFPIQTP